MAAAETRNLPSEFQTLLSTHDKPILVDFWAKGPKYQRTMLWVVVGLFFVTMAGFLPRHLMNVFGGGH